MNRRNLIILILILILLGTAFALNKNNVRADSNSGTNISYTPGLFWAWNDLFGWVDHHTTHTVFLTGAQLKGYASSSVGDLTYDCATARGGSICAQSNFSVTNNASTTLNELKGWGWNDLYGWISMCGGYNTSDCPGSIRYGVEVDMNTGVFSGYAWNDVLGWISYNCTDIGSCTVLYRVVADSSTSTSAILESAPYDTGVSGGAQINSIMWKGTLPSGTRVYFQIASSNNSSGPWTFLGPGGTVNDFYGPLDPNVSLPVDYVLNNNKRYFKYKIVLYSDLYQYRTPVVEDVIINWSQ